MDSITIEILEAARKYSDFFDGVYDITVMPLIRLWGFYREKRRTVPSLHEIEKAKKNNVNLVLAVDAKIGDDFSNDCNTQFVSVKEIPDRSDQ